MPDNLDESGRPRGMPADTPTYMAPAWADCIRFALGDPEILEAFRKETGNRWQPGSTAIERMIDDSTGAGDGFLADFIAWANLNVWGPVNTDSGADAEAGADITSP